MILERNGNAYEILSKEEAESRNLQDHAVYWRTWFGPPLYPPRAKYVIGDDGSYHEVVAASRSILTLPAQVVSTRISCYLKHHQDERWKTQVFPHDDPFDANRPISPRERKIALTYIATGFNVLETYHKAMARNEQKSRLSPPGKRYDLKKRALTYLTRPAVEKFIVKSIQSTMSASGMDDDYLISKLRGLIEDEKRPNIALEALKIGFKLAGHLDKPVQQPQATGLIGFSYEEVMKLEGKEQEMPAGLLEEIMSPEENEPNK